MSPITASKQNIVFDGGDCRFGVEANSYSKKQNSARFKIISLSCTDNEGVAYSVDTDSPIGYISPESKPGTEVIEITDHEGFLTVDINSNYFVQLYKPVEFIAQKGISLFGRF